jgi:site-specific recombinase XerD
MVENGLKPAQAVNADVRRLPRAIIWDWHSLEYPDSHYRTAQILEQHVPEEFAAKRLGDWSHEDIEDLKTRWRKQRFADATVVKHLNTIRGLFTHATESPKKSGIAANPCANVKWPKVLESKPHLFFERDQLTRIYE